MILNIERIEINCEMEIFKKTMCIKYEAPSGVLFSYQNLRGTYHFIDKLD